jgi:hypothetical protein
LNKIGEDFKELKVKLEEKERALDAMNLYSRANRDSNPAPVPAWKQSSTSLNATLQDTPHDKRKEYDRKVKEKIHRPKVVEEKPKLDRPTKLDSDRRENVKVVNEQVDEEQQQQYRKKEIDDQKAFDEEEAELKRKDERERQKRERDEKERIERIRKEAADLEAEKRRKQLEKEKEEEKRRLKEKAILEDMERKKRWVANDLDEETSESKKKNDLLAKLFSNDETPETNVTPVAQPIVKKSVFDTPKNNGTPTNNFTNSSSNINNKITNNNQTESFKFPRKIENLHEGKPSNSRDDDLFSNHSSTNNNNNKNDLLDKLFGNSSTNAAKPTSNNYLQNKLDKLDDYPADNKAVKSNLQTSQSFKSTQNTSKVPFLPWDIPEAQTGTPNSTKKRTTNDSLFTQNGGGDGGFFSSTQQPANNAIRRPKETNSIFTSNKINTNSNNFIEDIEELTL